MNLKFGKLLRGLSPAALACWLALTIAPQLKAQGGEPQYFAIRGATVFTGSGQRIENATVVVAHGVITAVGVDARIPEQAWVIDGKGLNVYPGLFDAFTDVGIPPATPAAAAPPPQSRGPEDRPGSTPWRKAAQDVNLSDARIATWRSGGFTTVLCAPKGGIFPGQAAVLDLAGEHNGDLIVKTHSAVPVSLEFRNYNGFPDSLMGYLAYVHQVWLDTDWMTKAWATYEKNPRGVSKPRFDRTDAALRDALATHAVVMIPGNSSTDIRRALRLAERWQVNAVLYGGQMSYEVADEIAAKKMPVLIDLKWPEAEKDPDPDAVPSLRELRFRDRAPSSPAAMAKAGASFAFYSGTLATPKDILKAVKKSVDAGLTPDAALRALTLTPAEIFGVADRMGSIENGKIANLVITEGDLLDEKSKIRFVFVEGRKFDIHEAEKPKEPPKASAGEIGSTATEGGAR
jgi:imidazolonepropionase-like amidohydrolase